MKVSTTNGSFFLIDNEDFEEVCKFKWANSYHLGRIRKTSGPREALHNFLMGNPPKGFTWDHIDRDYRNNHRANLRLATPQQQSRNQDISVKKGTKYKGISLYRNGKWRVQIADSNGKNIHIGYFTDEEEAARVWDKVAKVYHGEFAVLNFPE
jgi:hypothetical protein